MTAARARFAIAAILFAGWIGWLAYLAFTKTEPVVVSRSQVMDATHFVLADIRVDGETGEAIRDVTIVEDLRPVGLPLTGTIRVVNLRDARVGGRARNFSRRGPYLLPLTRHADGSFELTPPPRSPGNDAAARPWAYYWEDDGVARQFDHLVPKRP